MAVPTDITATSIATEALKQSGVPNPTAAVLARAESEWLRMSLQAVARVKDIKLYEGTKIAVLESFKNRYELPEDFQRMIFAQIIYGTKTGTSQAVTSNSITLDATETSEASFFLGKEVAILAGTGKNQVARIPAYADATKVASIDPVWDVIPDAASSYVIIENEVKELEPVSKGEIGSIMPVKIPERFYIYGRPQNKEIIFESHIGVDVSALIRIKYQKLTHKVDLTDVLMSEVYNELQEELTQGVLMHALHQKDEERYQAAVARFDRMLGRYGSTDARERRGRGGLFTHPGGMPLSRTK